MGGGEGGKDTSAAIVFCFLFVCLFVPLCGYKTF